MSDDKEFLDLDHLSEDKSENQENRSVEASIPDELAREEAKHLCGVMDQLKGEL